MKRVNISRIKAKIKQYKSLKNVTKNSMISGDVNDYIKDLIELYNKKTQLNFTPVLIPISNN